MLVYVNVMWGIMMMAFKIKIVLNAITNVKIALYHFSAYHVRELIETISAEAYVNVMRGISMMV
jgi:hypothetical protein